MPAKCGACVKFVSRNDAVLSCDRCKVHYHPACVGLPIGGKLPKDWSCPECQRILPRDNKSETPVRGFASNDDGVLATASGDLAGLSMEIRLFREELAAMRNEIREFRSEFHDLRTTMCTMNERLEIVEKRMDAMEKQVTESTITVGSGMLEEAVADLQCQLQERDQDLLANDVQLSNVPEMPEENLTHLAILIGAKLGLKLDEQDMVSVVRVGVRRAGGDAAGRPRPIAVRLARRAIRDDLLRAARVRREATTADMGLPGPPCRFYVNERLTGFNRRLFAIARERSRSAGWKHVWTRNGRVLVRQADGTAVHKVRKESDLTRVFGVGAVGPTV